MNNYIQLARNIPMRGLFIDRPAHSAMLYVLWLICVATTQQAADISLQAGTAWHDCYAGRMNILFNVTAAGCNVFSGIVPSSRLHVSGCLAVHSALQVYVPVQLPLALVSCVAEMHGS